MRILIPSKSRRGRPAAVLDTHEVCGVVLLTAFFSGHLRYQQLGIRNVTSSLVTSAGDYKTRRGAKRGLFRSDFLSWSDLVYAGRLCRTRHFST
ncbi:hypothetical protein BJX62DRAFT_216006 [Aspergillus germanicus]